VVKGDSVVKKNAVKQNFFFAIDREQKIEDCTIKIFYSESVKPEQRVEGGKTSQKLLLSKH
jgi:hypothetical protein